MARAQLSESASKYFTGAERGRERDESPSVRLQAAVYRGESELEMTYKLIYKTNNFRMTSLKKKGLKNTYIRIQSVQC